MRKTFNFFAIFIFTLVLNSCVNPDTSSSSFSEEENDSSYIEQSSIISSEYFSSEQESSETSSENSMKYMWESNRLLSMIPYPDFGNVIKINLEMEDVSVGNIVSSVGAVVSNTDPDDFYHYFEIVRSKGFYGTNSFAANVYNAILTKENYYLVFSQSGNLLTLTIQERI